MAGCDAVVLGQSLAALIDELEEAPTSKRLLVDNVAAIILAEGGESKNETLACACKLPPGHARPRGAPGGALPGGSAACRLPY